MSDGNSDLKNPKKLKIIKNKIFKLKIINDILNFISIFFLISIIIFGHIGYSTIYNNDFALEFISNIIGSSMYSNNKDLVEDNLESFFNQIDPLQSKYKDKVLFKVSEEDFKLFIIHLKIIDSNSNEYNIKQPCQFYSYLWAKYYDYNHIKYEYHYTSNHVFLIVERDFGYSIIDQQDIKDFLLN